MNENFLFAPFEQLSKSPATALVILPIAIVAILLEVWKKFPSGLVPWVCLLLGCLLYPNLVKVDTVPKEFPHPMLVLVLTGFLLGFGALIFHGLIFKLLIKKFLPDGVQLPAFLNNTTENKNNGIDDQQK